jgi:hypothetical protein
MPGGSAADIQILSIMLILSKRTPKEGKTAIQIVPNPCHQ